MKSVTIPTVFLFGDSVERSNPRERRLEIVPAFVGRLGIPATRRRTMK